MGVTLALEGFHHHWGGQRAARLPVRLRGARHSFTVARDVLRVRS